MQLFTAAASYFTTFHPLVSRKNFIPVFCTKKVKSPIVIKWMLSIDFSALYFLEFAAITWRNIHRFSPKPELRYRPTSYEIHAQDCFVYVAIV